MSKRVTSILEFFREPMATKLEEGRAKKRGEGKRLVYDCLNAQVEDENLVGCKKGHVFHIGQRQDGKISLETVLRGTAVPLACKQCSDYKEDEEGEK